jgi:two-component sensor histidine kinase
MSTATPNLLSRPTTSRQPIYAAVLLGIFTLGSLFAWRELNRSVTGDSLLPHWYCFLGRASLVWTHVVSDALIAFSYLAISVTLIYLVSRGRRDVPFHWMFLAFGLFIIACGSTHLVELITVWRPVYVLLGALKVFTAAASLATAVVLPVTIPKILTMIRQAKVADQITAELRESEVKTETSLREKEVLLKEVHHRVKNNLAVICSLFYLESTYAKDEHTAQVFRESENRVHAMALVHETLYGSQNLARIDLGEYANRLAADVLSSYGNRSGSGRSVRLTSDLQPVTVSIEVAVPCGLILNELISNAIKHGYPEGRSGEITMAIAATGEGHCTIDVSDDGVGVPAGLDVNNNKSLGLRLVRALTKQLHGSFELKKNDNGTSARLDFPIERQGVKGGHNGH